MAKKGIPWPLYIKRLTRANGKLNNGGCSMCKCLICEARPANSGGICLHCGSKLEAECKRKTSQNGYFRYVHYRGIVVGFRRNGKGVLIPDLLKRQVKYLPKGKLIDLDHYQAGFTREQVKKMKKTCLQLAGY